MSATSCRECLRGIVDGSCDRHAAIIQSRDGQYAESHHNLDSLFLKVPSQSVTYVLPYVRKEVAGSLQERHPRSEPSEHLCSLNGDVAPSQHNQGFGLRGLEIRRFAGEVVDFAQVVDQFAEKASVHAGRQDHPISRQIPMRELVCPMSTDIDNQLPILPCQPSVPFDVLDIVQPGDDVSVLLPAQILDHRLVLRGQPGIVGDPVGNGGNAAIWRSSNVRTGDARRLAEKL
jgi:hypothetical protein